MAKGLKVVGGFLVASGLLALLTFAFFIVRDDRFARAQLLMTRNPGNVMYESQYFAAFTIRAFLFGGAACGGLLALNGTTMLLLGVWAGRLEALPPPPGAGEVR